MTSNMKTCSAKNPTTAPVALKMNETMEPMIPGKAAADFLANSFNHSANFLSPSLILSGIDGDGGVGVGVGVGDGGVGVVLPFIELLIAKPIVLKVMITAARIAAIVMPSTLKSNLSLSLSGIFEFGCLSTSVMIFFIL